MSAFVVARRLRADETHLGEPGEWRLVPDVLDRDEADNRTRYFKEVLKSRSIAIDLDDYEALFSRKGRTK